MRQFAVRAERGTVGFLPVRALINTGVTATWPRQARVGLRLIAPEDPACAANEDDGSRAERMRRHGAGRFPHRDRVVHSLREIGLAWLDQMGPCRVDVVDADLLDEGSRLFFAILDELGEGMITLHRPADRVVEPEGLIPTAASPRERHIELLASSAGRLSGEEADFLYRQAVGYLGTGDGWTAERILRTVQRHRPTPAGRAKLQVARTMLGHPPGVGHPSGSQAPVRRPAGADTAARGPLRLTAGWELLERWSRTACQIHRNAVHKALFAIADRSVFRAYETDDVPGRPLEFSVLVRDGLFLKIRIRDLDTFEITHVGAHGEAPGREGGTLRAA
ncbi:DUF6235 family protein [Streptomyces sp. BE147]|uniref:DUF6235 family protein n=1 Tax=unclassified Streptomyces TaxID=2593676 RepID=UPI002E7AA175|nr:DUF6235 family protein [Streptomyces sp. BE147]MEE1740473.1 DUF6235 family protein [Streptomyces sp. BE147]